VRLRYDKVMSAPPELPPGYAVRSTEFGIAEIGEALSPGVWLLPLVGAFGALCAGVGIAAFFSPYGWSAGGWNPWFHLAFVFVGLAMIVASLGALFVESTWIVGARTLARRHRLRFLGRSWLREYRDARGLELVHGVWRDGRGRTDELFLITEDYRKVQIQSRNWLTSWTGGEFEEYESVCRKLGHYLSWRSGLPLKVREFTIAPPDD
jgi:hypothetical protein